MKKKVLAFLAASGVSLLPAAFLAAQDTTPRGPAEWTGRNWLGFSIQIIVFILAVVGIYKLADPGEEEEAGEEGDGDNPESTPA